MEKTQIRRRTFFTVREVADLLRFSPTTIRRYIRAGRLRAVKIKRGIRIPLEAINELMLPIL